MKTKKTLQSARTAKIVVAINFVLFQIGNPQYIKTAHTTGSNRVDITSKVVCSGQQDSFIEIQVVFFLKLYILKHPNSILHRNSKCLISLLELHARNISYLHARWAKKTMLTKLTLHIPIFCKR